MRRVKERKKKQKNDREGVRPYKMEELKGRKENGREKRKDNTKEDKKIRKECELNDNKN